jgi:predicted N-acetyltransferase YhbS
VPVDQYLPLATTLLQQIRLARPTGGIWEAADLQWWARQERSTDSGQLFWLDQDGAPVAAAILTDWGEVVAGDVFVLPDDPDLERAAWRAAIARAQEAGGSIEFSARADYGIGIAELTAAGYRVTDERGVVATWLDAADRPVVPPLPAGYRLRSRPQSAGQPHPMVARNGPQVAQRLRQCSLYRPELDLMVESFDGKVAGYGLFWADQVTGVGLVEPMRTQDEHQRRGIASHLLAAGLERLADQGCRRLKVSNDLNLYLRAGFEPLPAATAALYAKGPTPSSPGPGAMDAG